MASSTDPATASADHPSIDETTSNPPASTADLPSKLDNLKAQATQQYALKNYPAAAELYSEAAEVQDELNGEMSPDNADLLYQYGRCLYHVAVSNSDVLGGKVASSEEPKRKKRKTAKAENGEGSSKSAGVIGDAMRSGKAEEDGVKEEVKKEDKDALASKPFFQITGDENWTDSEDEDEEGDDAAADAEAEEEEDDFAIAYEILDVARVLLQRKIAQQDDGDQQRQLKERLADTHDLQAEINLENERFTDAIKDTRDSLSLKTALYPEESSLLAEAHFKLSLALEFASVTSTSEDPTADADAPAQVDEAMRAEAATEMELAIASCNARIAKESALLPSLSSTPASHAERSKSEQERSIADVKEMVADMQQRLLDLRNPASAVSLSGVNATELGDGTDAMGLLGQMLGKSEGQRKKVIEEATAGANDLSGMVKKRKKGDDAAVPSGNSDAVVGKGKRKVGEVGIGNGDEGGSGKQVKFSEERA